MAGDFKTELGAFRLFTGDPDQDADQLMASAAGAARTPAHRGFSYGVFEDLQLADYGNPIPSLPFEVFSAEYRKSVVSGKSVDGRLDHGGRRISQKQKK